MKLDSGAATALANQFAAVPSLHVGFAFAIGIALAAALRPPALRAAALLWGPLVLLTVVATGNHFVFDAVAGLVLTAVGYAVSRAAATVRRPTTLDAGARTLGVICPLEKPAPPAESQRARARPGLPGVLTRRRQHRRHTRHVHGSGQSAKITNPVCPARGGHAPRLR